MLKSYLKTAYRLLLKNKTFSLINIIGLSLGTLCCLYIVLYVADQYSYDKHHHDAKDIYRINSMLKLPGGSKDLNSATSSPPIAPAMKNDFSEVVQYTRVLGISDFGVKQSLLRYRDRSLYEKNIVYADSTFFSMFTWHFTNGSASRALSEAYSIVLLKPVADKLFGNEDPIGKMVQIDNSYGKHDFKVTGVVDESLGKSHIHANVFMAMNSGGMGEYTLHDNSWAGQNFALAYIKLRPDADAAALEKKLPAFLNKYGARQLKSLGMEKQLHLEPIGTIHTTPGHDHEASGTSTVSSSFLRILLLIAILIQVIACINFMNLSTARASKRAREVGVRKVIGAGRGDLIRQFLGESFLLALLGVSVAVPLLWLALPSLNQVTGADIQLSSLANYRLWLMLAGFVTVTGLLAGSYPAFYLSAFQATKVIKGNFTNHISAAGIRRALVVFQFVLSIVLITGIIVIYSQLNYMKSKDLGFDKEQRLIFSFHTGDAVGRIPAFETDLQQLAEVKAVSRANNYPSQFVMNDWIYFLAGGNASTGQDIQMMYTDEHFLSATGIKIIGGRDFRKNDSGRVLINETLARSFGLDPKTATGTRIYPQQSPGESPAWLEIAGVMKDFNYNSLHDNVKPFMLRYDEKRDDRTIVIVKANSGDYKTFLGKIQAIWRRDFPSVPFEYSFLDDEVEKQYHTEITLSHIINSFTLMAIFISSLGLFGLAAFSAEQRNKEIGIRRILGASITGIVRLLSKDFLKLVGIAIIIAVPIAWWAMNRWLEAFAYKVTISWWMFALAGTVAILIALFTVSSQAIRTAMVNPVKSIRSE